jgi:hypothetical protein
LPLVVNIYWKLGDSSFCELQVDARLKMTLNWLTLTALQPSISQLAHMLMKSASVRHEHSTCQNRLVIYQQFWCKMFCFNEDLMSVFSVYIFLTIPGRLMKEALWTSNSPQPTVRKVLLWSMSACPKMPTPNIPHLYLHSKFYISLMQYFSGM